MTRFRLFLFLFLCVIGDVAAQSAEIWVSVNGSDAHSGTKEQPLATLSMALRKARELRRLADPSISKGIRILVKGGIYRLDEPVRLRPEDSGTVTSPTSIEAAPGEHPVLSGGIRVTQWKKLIGTVPGLSQTAKNRVWVTDAPEVGGQTLLFRQLWVNGVKATRAREQNADSMSRILSWNHLDESCWIPRPKTADISRLHGMEMLIQQWWATAVLRVRSAKVQGDSVQLRFFQPESRVQSQHPWPAPWISKKTGNSPYYLVNALPFLDRPGEWYLDTRNRKLYYWPLDGQDLKTAEVIAPNLETLVNVTGTIDHPVAYVSFKNIAFEHTGWTRPSLQGSVPHQAGMYMLEAYKLEIPGTPDKKTLENQAWVGRPAAAVALSYTQHTGFYGCSFRHLAATGLDYHRGNREDEIRGNLFRDIGGTAILAGVFSDEATEVHLPYLPVDEREITTGLNIHNNLVNDATNEDWGSAGIGAGYVRNIRIANNEVSGVSYTGISMGWGWTKTPNAMRNNSITGNKIHHYAKYLYDVAGIYSLSAQPGSVISRNVVDSIYKAPYPHDPQHWFYLYGDEGSSGFTVKDNWCPSEKFLQNANGPNNLWENNGPMVSTAIRQAAGLEKDYQYLLRELPEVKDNRPINQSRLASMMEIVSSDPSMLARLKAFAVKKGMAGSALSRWKDHIVWYGEFEQPTSLQQEIKKAFPTSEVKLYETPFYHFSRRLCDDKKVAAEWENIILTANLVADTTLQREYLRYHETQFKDWPEVSNGFCKADFQQLLVFKTGRQLMLVISIPKGKTLDELNPKTTENNPRVNDWNNLMKKYQEGLPGTNPGETWVFLEPIKLP